MTNSQGKLSGIADYHHVSAEKITTLLTDIFHKAGCQRDVAETVAIHLTEASLMGVPSHGVIERVQMEKNRPNGIALSQQTWQQLVALANRLGIDPKSV